MAIASLVPGQVFASDFVIERELAEGGMGVLCVALQRSTNKRRALKVMQPQLVSAKNPEQSEKNQQRFLAEARAAGGIDSEHIVEVVTAGIDDATGAPWMVMELLEGNDLDDELRRRTRIAPAECLSLFEQLCHALAAAHRAGVFHLDLKPENIFLARSRSARAGTTVKVLDFGIARLVSARVWPTPVRGLDHVQQVIAGFDYTCALREDHTLWCWGDNGNGQLGDPTFTNSARWTPAVVPNLSEVTSVALVSSTTLVTSNGAVLAWGSPLHDLVGPSSENVRAPTRHAGFDNGYATYVVGATYTSWACAGMSDVTMRCWGYNGAGSLGNGTTRTSELPVRTLWRRPRSIAFSEYTTCIATDQGEVFCFGSNEEGELGTGDPSDGLPTPQRLTGLSGAVQVSGAYRNLCAVLASGEVFCWGSEVESPPPHVRWRSNTPMRFEGLRDVTEMTGGYDRGCAIARDHTLRCWGMNVSGAVGESTPTPTPTLVTVQPDALTPQG